MIKLSPLYIENLARRALEEDLGHGHDITTQTLIPEGCQGSLSIRARAEGYLAGIDFALAAFRLMDPALQLTAHMPDGRALKPGDAILDVSGNAQSILTAERSALNFLIHLSGIATETQAYVDAVSGTDAAIACTRKTLPGLRAAQKYAVRVGGGKNHRFGLDDGILIKDNHIALAGSIGQAVNHARSQAGHMVKIEIEVDDLAQLEEALACEIDAVLLDNMAPETLRRAVALIDGRVTAEASGGITLKNVRAIAQTGVDVISVGALTHSVRALDLGLDIRIDA